MLSQGDLGVLNLKCRCPSVRVSEWAAKERPEINALREVCLDTTVNNSVLDYPLM